MHVCKWLYVHIEVREHGVIWKEFLSYLIENPTILLLNWSITFQ